MRSKFWRRTVSLLCAAALLGTVTLQAAGTGDLSPAAGENTAAAPVAGFAAEKVRAAAAAAAETAPQPKTEAPQPKEASAQPKTEVPQQKETSAQPKEKAPQAKTEASKPDTGAAKSKDADTKETDGEGEQTLKGEDGESVQEKAEVKEETASSEEKDASEKDTSEKEDTDEETETADQGETDEPAADAEASAQTETGESQEVSGDPENSGELSPDPEKADAESVSAQEEESEAAEETETAVEEAAEKAEDPDPEDPEDTEDPKEAGTFSNVSIATDTQGAYFTYEFVNGSDKSASLDFVLTDGSGNQVGNTVTFTASSQDSGRIYLLPLTGNSFGLSEADMGKTVSIRVTATNDIGETTAASAETITLTLPSISVPSIVGCSAADTAGDLYDPAKIKGLSYDNGSFTVQRSVEKQNGGWSTVSDGKAITPADQGTYRICLHTVFGDYYSNEFQLVVPATGLSVSGEERLGNTLTAIVEGVDGVTPEGLTYAWNYGDSTTPVGTESSYTASLEDAVNAESLKLTVTVKDLIGNEFSDVINLKPLDISKAGLKAQVDESPVYSGFSQVPEDAKILLDSFEIPDSLYTLAASDEKNSENAGKAWMTVTGIEPYLTGSTDLSFTIEKAETELEEEDFETEFAWDGKKHKPVLSDDSDVTGKLRYSKWKKLGADGSWKKMIGAPSDPGTYRVNVTVKPKDKNYKKAVIEEVVFTITGKKNTSKEVKKEKQGKTSPKQAPDLTVTDADGNAKPYTAAAEILRDEEQKETGRIYRIKAEPEKKADGTPETDENGKPVYRLRNLHISEDLVKKVKDANCTAIRFELGDAGLQIDLEALTRKGSYTVTIAPLEASDLTSLELSAAAGYNRVGRFYAVKVTGPDKTVQTAPVQGLSAYYRISDPAEAAGLLFLEENRDDLSGIPVVSDDTSEVVRENEILYITGNAASSGIFCAVA